MFCVVLLVFKIDFDNDGANLISCEQEREFSTVELPLIYIQGHEILICF